MKKKTDTAELDTINVIEYADDDILTVRSFNNTQEGQKKAMSLFKSCIKENSGTKEEIGYAVDDGKFSKHGYQVYYIASDYKTKRS